jgi:hypothetical protein
MRVRRSVGKIEHADEARPVLALESGSVRAPIGSWLTQGRSDFDAAPDHQGHGRPFADVEQARRLRFVELAVQRDASVDVRRGAMAQSCASTSTVMSFQPLRCAYILK